MPSCCLEYKHTDIRSVDGVKSLEVICQTAITMFGSGNFSKSQNEKQR